MIHVIASQTFVRVEEGGRRKGDEEDEEVASRHDEVKANRPRPPTARAEPRIHQIPMEIVIPMEIMQLDNNADLIKLHPLGRLLEVEIEAGRPREGRR